MTPHALDLGVAWPAHGDERFFWCVFAVFVAVGVDCDGVAAF